MKFVIACIILLSLGAFVQDGTPVQRLLQNPFDLQKFKKLKGPSNSGLADTKTYFVKPDGKGRYFYFFLFRVPGAFVYGGDKNKRTAVPSGSGFRIVTFKPLGRYQDDYFDPTETMVEVVASYNDPDLPELAFVGLDTLSVKRDLGEPLIRKEDSFIYASHNCVLLLNLQGGKVKCLKYARMNKDFSQDSISPDLLAMSCENKSLR
jgi:hypothetical protein